MPKNLLFITIAGFILSSTHAQSRDETINWIEKKINQYGKNKWINHKEYDEVFDHVYNSSVENGSIIISEKFGGITRVTTVSISDIIDAGFAAGEIVNARINYYGIVLTTNGYKMNRKNTFKSGDILNSDEEKIRELVFAIDWNAENNLIERMLKAFQHLGELNKPKEAS